MNFPRPKEIYHWFCEEDASCAFLSEAWWSRKYTCTSYCLQSMCESLTRSTNGIKSGAFSNFPWCKFATAPLHGADCYTDSAGKWFIPRPALICFARCVPLGRSLNTVAFAGNSFYSIRRNARNPLARVWSLTSLILTALHGCRHT